MKHYIIRDLSFDKLPEVNELLSKRTLIVGDVGSGKTRLTMFLIQFLMKLGLSQFISILDFAPDLMILGSKKVGGKLIDFNLDATAVKNYYTSTFYAPRLMGKSEEEVLRYASENRFECERLLHAFLSHPTSILIINDITIYYQIGDLGLLNDVLTSVDTFIANGYYGTTIKDKFGNDVSLNESTMTMKLMDLMDVVISLER